MSIAEKLQTIAENEQKVFDAGKENANKEFWIAVQTKEDGITPRDNYVYAFYHSSWSDKNFYPIYDIVPTKAERIFAYFGYEKMRVSVGGAAYSLNLVDRLEECGVKLDFSKCTSMPYAFQYGKISHLGVLDFSSLTGASNVFNGAHYLKSIEKIISKDSLAWNTSFAEATALIEIRFEGVIGKNIDFSPCTKLSYESLMSIIGALKTSGTTYTCTLGSTNLAKLTDTEKAIATEKGWTLA